MNIAMVPSSAPFAFAPTESAGTMFPHCIGAPWIGAPWIGFAAPIVPAESQRMQTANAEIPHGQQRIRRRCRTGRRPVAATTIVTIAPCTTTLEVSHVEPIWQAEFLWPATPDCTPVQSPHHHGIGDAFAAHNRQHKHHHQHLGQPPQYETPHSSYQHVDVGHRDTMCGENVTNPTCELSSPPASSGIRKPFEIASSMTQTGAKDQSVAWWTAAGAETLLHRLEQGSTAERMQVLRLIIDSAWGMAVRRHGCRVVQKAIEVAERPEQLALAEKLKTHVLEALRSPHANYVLQRCIVLLPPEHLQFVVVELRGHAGDIVRHRFGCRVVERLLEHFSVDATSGLVEEVLDAHTVAELCLHEFGNYVVQQILEHGKPHQRTRVVDGLVPHVRRLARHRVGSHVVERALMYCTLEDRQRLTDSISVDPNDLTKLSRSLYGSFVVRQLVRAEGM